jgi:hypothetical protein
MSKFSPEEVHVRLSEQCLESQAAFGTTLRVSGVYQKAGTSSLKRVTGVIFTISDFIEASRNFMLDFLHKKTANICKNHQRSFQKVLF